MKTTLQVKELYNSKIQLTNKVVLVVDDIQINYLLIKALMKPTGATVLWVDDGTKAVEVINSGRKVDLIFMDYNMPGMNGHEATILIKRKRKDLPVISQSAYTQGDEFQDINTLCDDILIKPVTYQTLLNMVVKHI